MQAIGTSMSDVETFHELLSKNRILTAIEIWRYIDAPDFMTPEQSAAFTTLKIWLNTGKPKDLESFLRYITGNPAPLHERNRITIKFRGVRAAEIGVYENAVSTCSSTLYLCPHPDTQEHTDAYFVYLQQEVTRAFHGFWGQDRPGWRPAAQVITAVQSSNLGAGDLVTPPSNDILQEVAAIVASAAAPTASNDQVSVSNHGSRQATPQTESESGASQTAATPTARRSTRSTTTTGDLAAQAAEARRRTALMLNQ